MTVIITAPATRALTEQEERELCLIVNEYYILMEAADMLLRKSEDYLAIKGATLKFTRKNRHNIMMQHIQSLKSAQESFFKDYAESFANILESDKVRRSGALMARLSLLIGDRCHDDEGKDTHETEIEQFIFNLTPKGFIGEKLLPSIHIR